MKQHILLLWLALPCIAQAQYTPLLSESNQWVEMGEFFDPQDPGPAEISYSFYFVQGDSLHNGELFQKVYQQLFFLDTWYTPNGTNLISNALQDPEFHALMREDSAYQQVLNQNNEVIYDFSLSVGQTFYYEAEPFLLDSITSIALNNGETRRKFYFSNMGDLHYWVEGVGGSNGLTIPFFLPPLSLDSYEGEIVCYSIDSVAQFGRCDQPDFIILAADRLEEQLAVEVFPNPAQDLVQIELPAVLAAWKIQLFDAQASLIQAQSLSRTNQTQVSLTDLPAGIYWLRIEGSNGKAASRKLLKY